MINSKSKIPSHAKSFPEKKDLFLALECFVNWWGLPGDQNLERKSTHTLYNNWRIHTTATQAMHCKDKRVETAVWNWIETKSRISCYSYTQQQHHVNTSCGVVLSVFWTRKVGFYEGHVCTWITRVYHHSQKQLHKPKKGFCSKEVCLPYDHTRLHHSDGGRVVHIKLPPRKKPYYSVPPSFKIRIKPIRAKHRKKPFLYAPLVVLLCLFVCLSVCLSVYFLLSVFWATPDDTQVQKPAVCSWKPKKPQQQLWNSIKTQWCKHSELYIPQKKPNDDSARCRYVAAWNPRETHPRRRRGEKTHTQAEQLKNTGQGRAGWCRERRRGFWPNSVHPLLHLFIRYVIQ